MGIDAWHNSTLRKKTNKYNYGMTVQDLPMVVLHGVMIVRDEEELERAGLRDIVLRACKIVLGGGK